MRKLKLPGRTRRMPRLNETDYKMIRKNGIREMKEQARQIIENKLKERPENDGKQIPKAGNPVYKALHACRASSRAILSNAHRMPEKRDLDEKEIDAVVNLITRWIAREYNFYRDEEARQGGLQEFSS